MSKFVIVAGGPSLTLAQCRIIGVAKQRDPDLNIIAVNDAIYPCWFADYAWACDGQWWDWHGGLPGYRGCKLKLRVRDGTGNEINLTRYGDVQAFECGGDRGLDLRPTHVTSGRNGGHQALHASYHLGARRVVLVAYDYRDVRNHWFGEHPEKIRRNTFANEWVELIERLGREMTASGVEIVNATPGSAITAFPFVDLGKELGVKE